MYCIHCKGHLSIYFIKGAAPTETLICLTTFCEANKFLISLHYITLSVWNAFTCWCFVVVLYTVVVLLIVECWVVVIAIVPCFGLVYTVVVLLLCYCCYRVMIINFVIMNDLCRCWFWNLVRVASIMVAIGVFMKLVHLFLKSKLGNSCRNCIFWTFELMCSGKGVQW